MKNPYFRVALFTLLLAGSIVGASSIKTWSNGDTLLPADINANFQHIHNTMVGNHGARLVNSDVSASANISYAKIQNGRGIARAFGGTATTCSSTPCSKRDSFNVGTITWVADGGYNVNLNYTAADTNYSALVWAETAGVYCTAPTYGSSSFSFECHAFDSTPANAQFDFVVFDDN